MLVCCIYEGDAVDGDGYAAKVVMGVEVVDVVDRGPTAARPSVYHMTKERLVSSSQTNVESLKDIRDYLMYTRHSQTQKIGYTSGHAH